MPEPPTPHRLLWAVVRARPGLVAGAAVSGAVWLAPGAAIPLLVGAGVEAGVARGDLGAAAGWATAIVGAGVVQAVFAALLGLAAHGLWIHGASALQRMVVGHATGLGASLGPQTEPGDVAAVSSTDLNRVGNLLELFGRVVGAVVAYAVVAGVLIVRQPLLGTVALVGVPLAVVGLGPLVAPLQRRKDTQRAVLTAVNARAADIVAGLRVLRGIGGEGQFSHRFAAATRRARDAGIAVARSESWLGAAEVLLPGLVTVVITWLAARRALAGELAAADLVTFYAAAAFLVIPVATAAEGVGAYAAAISALRRGCRLLALRTELPDPAVPRKLPTGPLALHDVATDVTAPAGALTVIDAGPASGALAARLARYVDHTAVTVGGVPVDEIGLAELRARVVLGHHQDLWFAGPLRPELEPPAGSAVDVRTALAVSAAAELVDSLPAGLDEHVGERGREISGGQRQRLSLARVLSLDADVLLLDEPTSAVDAHTEAAIVSALARLRRGRTTVVFSQSAIWRAAADTAITVPTRYDRTGGER